MYTNVQLQPLDIRGWDSEAPIFKEVIQVTKPSRIIEVGSWLGASAIHMAKICTELQLQTEIICVDTWLGSLEMLLYPESEEHQSKALNRKNGYPQLYYTFLSNVIQSGYAHMITPLPTTSAIAAEYFREKGITADLIYIDASHDYQSVLDDFVHYWHLLNPNGILFGDDYTWPGVKDAVQHQAFLFALDIKGSFRHWYVRKGKNGY